MPEQSGKRHAVRSQEVVECDTFRFSQAAAIHRTFLLRELLPAHELAVNRDELKQLARSRGARQIPNLESVTAPRQGLTLLVRPLASTLCLRRSVRLHRARSVRPVVSFTARRVVAVWSVAVRISSHAQLGL